MKRILISSYENQHLANLLRKLKENIALTLHEKDFLTKFLENLLNSDYSVEAGISNVPKVIDILDISKQQELFNKWSDRFSNLPGDIICNYFGSFEKNYEVPDALIEVNFYLSSDDYESDSSVVSLYLNSIGRAIFRFSKLEDAYRFPELDNFQGTWREAYFALVLALKKGWSTKLFPKDIQTFLEDYEK